jgi:N-acetylmuramoyl-L-alanine amidase
MIAQACLLDPGHGGTEPGAVAPDGTKEKDLNLSICHKIYKQYKKIDSGNCLILSRSSDFVMGLDARAQLQKEICADIFVSIHCNSFPNSSATGTEIYYFPGSMQGRRLADYIYTPLSRGITEIPHRGIKIANFHVLRKTDCPAVLLECGFMSNPRDLTLLKDEDFQEEIATAIAKGIKNYFYSNSDS